MAINRTPVLKRCRSLGLEPGHLGYTKKSNRNVQGNKKVSEYGLQLREKQKVKFIYGVLEKPFRNYYKKAERANGITGENLLRMLEQRFDNTVYRAGLASSRAEARQLVGHGHFLINGKKVDIPSYSMKVGQVISVREKSQASPKFQALAQDLTHKSSPAWMDVDKANMVIHVIALPERDQIDYPIQEQLIVELYSR